MWGTVCGEVASALFCLTTFQFRRCHLSLSVTKRLICFATPLTGSRVILNLFASAEAILIPSALTTFGLGRSDALSVFGTLTGMAMPVIMLPTVLTGSLSVLLLPAISEAAAKGDRRQIVQTIRRTVELCVILGLACTLAYLLFGRFVGSLLFRSSLLLYRQSRLHVPFFISKWYAQQHPARTEPDTVHLSSESYGLRNPAVCHILSGPAPRTVRVSVEYAAQPAHTGSRLSVDSFAYWETPQKSRLARLTNTVVPTCFPAA